MSSTDIKTSMNLELFDTLQEGAIRYFIDNVNPSNGLVADSTWEGAPSSIAAVGLALATYPVAVEHRLMTRAEAVERTLTTLRFSKTARKVQSLIPPAIKVSIITFLT